MSDFNSITPLSVAIGYAEEIKKHVKDALKTKSDKQRIKILRSIDEWTNGIIMLKEHLEENKEKNLHGRKRVIHYLLKPLKVSWKPI